MFTQAKAWVAGLCERLYACDTSRLRDKAVFATITGVLCWLLDGFIGLMGGIDLLLEVMTIFIVIDFITGIIVAILNGEISSRICFRGGAVKIMKFLLVVVAFQMDRVTGGITPLREIAIMFMIANEGISILENLGYMGIISPTFMQKYFKQVRDKFDKGETNKK